MQFGILDLPDFLQRLKAICNQLKRTWINHGKQRKWIDIKQGEGQEFLRQSTEVKNIWIPYGE